MVNAVKASSRPLTLSLSPGSGMVPPASRPLQTSISQRGTFADCGGPWRWQWTDGASADVCPLLAGGRWHTTALGSRQDSRPRCTGSQTISTPTPRKVATSH